MTSIVKPLANRNSNTVIPNGANLVLKPSMQGMEGIVAPKTPQANESTRNTSSEVSSVPLRCPIPNSTPNGKLSSKTASLVLPNSTASSKKNGRDQDSLHLNKVGASSSKTGRSETNLTRQNSALARTSSIRTPRNTNDISSTNGFKNGKTPSTKAPTTGTSGIRGAPLSASNTHGTKSLKDHLSDIGGAKGTSRQQRTEAASTTSSVAAASAPRKLSRPLVGRTSVTSALAPKSKASETAAALAAKEKELEALQQRYDSSLTKWNSIFNALCVFSQWSLSNNDELREESSQRQTELKAQVEASREECVQAKKRIEELQEHHAQSQQRDRDAFETQMQNLRAEMEAIRVALTTERDAEIEKARLQRDADVEELQKAFDKQLAEGRQKWATQVAESRHQLDQQRTDYEMQISELKRLQEARVTELQNDLESTEKHLSAELERLRSECEELRRQAEASRSSAAAEFSTQQLPSSTQPEMADCSVQIPSSPEENGEDATEAGEELNDSLHGSDSGGSSSSRAVSKSFNFDDIPISMTRSCYTPQARPVVAADAGAHSSFLSPTTSRLHSAAAAQHPGQRRPASMLTSLDSANDSMMQEEIESLKAVLEMKSAEAADLRQRTMQLEEELETSKDLTAKIAELKSRNVSLEALLEFRTKSKEQMQDQLQELTLKLEKEVEEKRKFKSECEVLSLKLLSARHRIKEISEKDGDGEEDSFDMPSSCCMSNSMHVDLRQRNSPVVGRTPRPISAMIETSASNEPDDDRLPAGSFISLETRPATGGSIRLWRGLQHDRSKRRTLATSAELDQEPRR